jgi:Flp pilus assembly protein CpaB
MTSRNLLIAGAILGVIAVVLVNVRIGQIESQQEAVAVLRLAPLAGVAAGERIDETMLETQLLPEELESVTRVAIPDDPQSRTWVVGRMATRDVPAGSLLLYEFFADRPEERFAAQIGEGMRALSIPVGPASAVSYFVEPGSRVDVIGTAEFPVQNEVKVPPASAQAVGIPSTLTTLENKVATKTFLQSVRVLAVGQATTRGAYLGTAERGFGTVTLEVDPLQAEKLVFAMAHVQGGLTLVLRNPADEAAVEIESVDWSQFDGESDGEE